MHYESFIFNNFGNTIVLLFNIIYKFLIQSLNIFNDIGSIFGSIAVDPTQF